MNTQALIAQEEARLEAALESYEGTNPALAAAQLVVLGRKYKDDTLNFARVFSSLPEEARPAMAALVFIVAGQGTEGHRQAIREWVEQLDATGQSHRVGTLLRYLAHGGDPGQFDEANTDQEGDTA